MATSTAYAAAATPTKPNGFSADMGLSQAFSYDSNPLRLTTDEDALYGSTTSPQLTLRWKSPRTSIESYSRVDANYYDQSEYDSIDFTQKFDLSRRNERWTASLAALLQYDTTRTSEVTNFALNLPKVRSRKLSATPQITFRSTARSSWVLTASAAEVTYDNNAFTDYNTYSVSPSYEYKINPSNTGTLTIRGQRYETTSGTELISDSYGPALGWTSVINPRLTIRASAGGLQTHKRGDAASSAGDRSSWNYVFNASAIYKGDQDTTELSYTRAREPFGNGTETLLDTITFNERHALNQTVFLKAQAKYQSADYSTEPGVNLDYSYSAGGGLGYKLNDRLEVSADYRYRSESLTSVSDEIDQHIVLFSIQYAPQWLGY